MGYSLFKFFEKKFLGAVSGALGRPLTYRLVWLHPLDGIVLEDVEARGLFRAQRLSVQLSLRALWERREIYSVRLSGAYLNLDSLPKGKPKPKKKPRREPKPSKLSLYLDALSARACTLVVAGQTYTAERLWGSVSLSGGRWGGHAEAEGLGGLGLRIERASVDFRVSPSSVELFNLRARGDLGVSGGRLVYLSKENYLELAAKSATWSRLRLGRFHLGWWMDSGRLEGSAASVSWDTLSVFRVLLSGSWKEETLRIRRLTALWEGNFLVASGELVGFKRWRVRLEAPSLSWQGVQVSGAVEAEGEDSKARAHLFLESTGWRGWELGSVEAWLKTGTWREFELESLRVQGPLFVLASGEFDVKGNLKLTFSAEDRGLLGARGFARAEGEFVRKGKSLELSLSAEARRFKWRKLSLKKLSARLAWRGGKKADLALWLAGARFGDFSLDSAHMEGAFGDTLGGAVVFLRSKEGWLSAEVAARYSGSEARLEAQRLTLNMRGIDVLRARGAVLTVSPEAWSFSVPRGEAFFGTLSFGGTFRGESLEVAGVLDSVSLEALGEALAVRDTLEGTAAAFFNLSGTLSEPRIPSITLFGRDIRWGSWRLDSVSAALSYSPGTLRVDSASLLAEGGEVRLSGRLPVGLSLSPFSVALDPDAPLEAKASLRGSAKPLEGLFSEFLVLEGSEVQGEVLLYGTLARPLLTGSVKLRASGGVLVSTNTYLKSIEGQVVFEGDKLTLANIRARADGGEALVSGRVVLYPELASEVSVQVSDFPIMPDPFLEARVSGTLEISGKPARPFIKGDLTVDEAYFYAPIGYQPPPSAAAKPNLAKYEIHIRAPRKVYFSNELADIELSADILVEKKPAAPLTLSGELEAISGRIYFLDRVFDLREAKLRMARQSELNPEIHAVGETKVEDYLIRITVDGDLRQPQVRLTSEPPLPEGEIISMLTVGTAPGASQATSRALNLAEGLLSRELRRRIRLRELEVRTGLGGEAQMILGMYLTKNLYFRYTGDLSGAGSESYELKYYIRSNLAIYTKKDPQGTGAGFEFRFRF